MIYNNKSTLPMASQQQLVKGVVISPDMLAWGERKNEVRSQGWWEKQRLWHSRRKAECNQRDLETGKLEGDTHGSCGQGMEEPSCRHLCWPEEATKHGISPKLRWLWYDYCGLRIHWKNLLTFILLLTYHSPLPPPRLINEESEQWGHWLSMSGIFVCGRVAAKPFNERNFQVPYKRWTWHLSTQGRRKTTIIPGTLSKSQRSFLMFAD